MVQDKSNRNSCIDHRRTLAEKESLHIFSTSRGITNEPNGGNEKKVGANNGKDFEPERKISLKLVAPGWSEE